MSLSRRSSIECLVRAARVLCLMHCGYAREDAGTRMRRSDCLLMRIEAIPVDLHKQEHNIFKKRDKETVGERQQKLVPG